ncbi:hypothetical protein COW81_00960 [Candidatus Campbellbacteria bacterium CG22_combo_CG10-13_8_21_14_all_36_13]|uniref:TVP38/TMEM64 family membrane protein n=1 Tax=Candidatus Campbellbacteria bacterium CG22_combo_CG10-13_8_21_14_all_36_13 TaxID=1974529 RepID=A0A2H0DYM2_9BACT|nr:MAG: hypothetical protein COW81_00960 [Candidatus Campbellbacteria bacterium CG22_combo_CG10-13_8_21_14_all_36_13]
MTGGELLLGQSLFDWLTAYGYFILPVIILLFGPVGGFVAGFLASLDVFNPFAVFGIWVITTTTVDSFLFALGKFGEHLLRKFKRSRKILEKITELENNSENTWVNVLKDHFVKIFFFLKISPTVAISDSLAIVAGVLDIKFSRLYTASFLGQIIWSAVFISFGYYLGGVIQDIKFLINTTGIILGLGFIITLLYIKFLHGYFMSKLSNIFLSIKDLFSKNSS